MNDDLGKRITVNTGKFYMKSGSIIPFCVLNGFAWETKWEDGSNRITSINDYVPLPFFSRGIGKINHIDWGNVEAIVTESSEEVYESELVD